MNLPDPRHLHKDFRPGSLAWVKRFLHDQQIYPSRKLGQNFLADSGVIGRIVAASGLGPEDVCLEIGPGLGSLTSALAITARRVVSVEVDYRLADAMRQMFASNPVVSVVEADFLKWDLAGFLAELESPVRVVANIPYSITTPIIEKLFQHKSQVINITLLVQKEVAARLVAKPGSSDYSSLSLFTAYHSECFSQFQVNRRVFYPVPDVDSTVVTLHLKPSPLDAAAEQVFFRLLRAAFGQRRKVLPNAISAGMHLERDLISGVLEGQGISLKARGEELSLEQFMALATALQTVLTEERSHP